MCLLGADNKKSLHPKDGPSIYETQGKGGQFSGIKSPLLLHFRFTQQAEILHR